MDVGLPLDGAFSFEEIRRPLVARVSPVTLGEEMYLYLKLDGSLADIARKMSEVAFVGWHSERRYGLNLGGGEYFEFTRPGAEVILVCNDADHPDVFIEERKQFPFYFHWREGGDEVLAEIQDNLSGCSIPTEMHEDT